MKFQITKFRSASAFGLVVPQKLNAAEVRYSITQGFVMR